MRITLGQARKALAPYAGKNGKCETSDDTRLFVIRCIERLLRKGAHGNEKKWEFCTDRECFTAPANLEVPLKFSIDGFPERVWSKWYEFYDGGPLSGECHNASGGLQEEANEVFTIYDLPPEGARIVAIPVQDEPGATITVQGIDCEGQEIYTQHNGIQLSGEKLDVSLTAPTYSTKVFKKIIGITKTKTNNYVRLYWFNPVTKQQGLLAQYAPYETIPSYKRWRVIPLRGREGCYAKISVLGRVRMLDYFHDNEILPITNLDALIVVAQGIQSEATDNFNGAAFKARLADALLRDENEYNQSGEEGFDITIVTSGGGMENLQ